MTYEINTPSSSDETYSLEYGQFSSRHLCSTNIKNGRGNGSCSGNLTIQFATEFGSFVFLVTGNLVYN